MKTSSELASRLKPVTPILDEHNIVEVLAAPAAVETNFQTRTGSCLAVLTAFDRRVSRDYFYEMLVDASNLNEYLRRAEMISRVMYDMERGQLTKERCQLVVANLLGQAEKHRHALHRRMSLVAEMPYENDTIN